MYICFSQSWLVTHQLDSKLCHSLTLGAFDSGAWVSIVVVKYFLYAIYQYWWMFFMLTGGMKEHWAVRMKIFDSMFGNCAKVQINLIQFYNLKLFFFFFFSHNWIKRNSFREKKKIRLKFELYPRLIFSLWKPGFMQHKHKIQIAIFHYHFIRYHYNYDHFIVSHYYLLFYLKYVFHRLFSFTLFFVINLMFVTSD